MGINEILGIRQYKEYIGKDGALSHAELKKTIKTFVM